MSGEIETLTPAEVKSRLNVALDAVGTAHMLLAPHIGLFEAFARERRDMEAFGGVLAPQLYFDREKREVGDTLAPVLTAALALCRAMEAAEQRRSGWPEARHG